MNRIKLCCFCVLLIINVIILSINSFISYNNKKNIEYFLKSEIIELKIHDLKKTNVITETNVINSFIFFITNSEITSRDFERGEICKNSTIELVNNQNDIYKVSISYSNEKDIIRVIFYDEKSKATQVDYLKNNYFDDFLELITHDNIN